MSYMLENSAATARERLQTFERILDPKTQSLLMPHLPVRRMWIPGAGAGSIATWVAPYVQKELVVTDIDTRFLTKLGDKVTVYQHDLMHDPSPGKFDLIAVRLLLCHLPQRETALKKLIKALSPGGLLLIEEPVHGVEAIAGKSKQIFNDTMLGMRNLQQQRGFSYDFTETIPHRMFQLGLKHVQSESSWRICANEAPILNLIRITWSHVAASTGLDITPALDILDDDDLVLTSFKNLACWGWQSVPNRASILATDEVATEASH